MDNGKKYNNITDCVVDAQKGIDGAFDALYSMSYPYAYSAASHLLKTKEDIEDSLQSSFYYVSKNISGLREPSAYLKWLNTIVINECKKILLEHNKHSKIFFAEKNRLMMTEDSKDIDSNLIEKSDLIETISKIVDEMNPKKSEILKLYYFENLSYSEISEKLGIPIGTVMSRLFNAKRELEKKVKELQKDGTILWSFPVIPLVAALLSYNIKANVPVAAFGKAASGTAAASAASGASAAVSVSSASAAAGTVSAASGAVGSGAATAAVTAGTSIAVKAAVVAVAATVAVGGGVAAKQVIKNQTASAGTAISETQSNTEKYLSEMRAEELFEMTGELQTEADGNENSNREPSDSSLPLTSGISTSTSVHESTSEPGTASISEKQTSENKVTERTRRSESKSSTAASTTQKPTEKQSQSTDLTTTAPTTNKTSETTTKAASTTADPSVGLSVSGGVLNGYSGSGGTVNIPSTVNGQAVTAIGAGAFEGSNITSVSIPSGVTKIGQTSFSDCKKLTSVSLPSTLTGIGDCAFDGCSSLNSITIPDSVTSIGDDAFDGCDNLTIRCSEGSAAYEYAVENSVDYELI